MRCLRARALRRTRADRGALELRRLILSNGHAAPGAPGFGHVAPHGGGARNAFGSDFGGPGEREDRRALSRRLGRRPAEQRDGAGRPRLRVDARLGAALFHRHHAPGRGRRSSRFGRVVRARDAADRSRCTSVPDQRALREAYEVTVKPTEYANSWWQLHVHAPAHRHRVDGGVNNSWHRLEVHFADNARAGLRGSSSVRLTLVDSDAIEGSAQQYGRAGFLWVRVRLAALPTESLRRASCACCARAASPSSPTLGSGSSVASTGRLRTMWAASRRSN